MNIATYIRRIFLGTGLALIAACLAVSSAGAQNPNSPAGQTSIATDKDAYVVGEPITITYTLPGPGRIRITDHQGAKVTTLRDAYSAQTTGRIQGTATPPAGKECLKIEYTDSKNQKSTAETCFEVRDKAGPDQPKEQGQTQGQAPAPGLYTLRNRGSGFVLDSDPEKNVYPHAPNDGAYQKWMVEAAPDGHVSLRGLATGFYLDSNPQGHVYAIEKNGGQYQQWKVEPVDDGYVILRNRATGNALADSSEAIFAGEPIGGSKTNASYQWKLTATQPPAQAAAPPTLGAPRFMALGTEATITVASSEPATLMIDFKPMAPATAPARQQASNLSLTTHEVKLTGLTSNTTYTVTITARTSDHRTATAQGSFTTTKKRVRVTLREINVTEDGDIFWMNGEPTWYTRLEWAGGSSGGCFPIDCQVGSYSEERILPRNPQGQPLMWLLAEENFDAMPTNFTLNAGAYESDDVAFLSRVAVIVGHFVSCVGRDCLGALGLDELDFTSQEWQAPAGQDFASTTVILTTDSSGQDFRSTMAFTFELFHDNLSYPAARNTPLSTWHR